MNQILHDNYRKVVYEALLKDEVEEYNDWKVRLTGEYQSAFTLGRQDFINEIIYEYNDINILEKNELIKLRNKFFTLIYADDEEISKWNSCFDKIREVLILKN